MTNKLIREGVNNRMIDTTVKPLNVLDKDTGEVDKNFTIKKQLIFRIRKLASLDRIKLDLSEHQSGLNLHLIQYLQYCEIEPLDYVKDYLKHLQPFMIEKFPSQEYEGAICILDTLYRISVYIKIDAKKSEELIVSFHENNKYGIAKKNSVVTKFTDVYVIPDSIEAIVEGTDTASIKLFITRGVFTFPLIIAGKRYDDDGFMIHYAALQEAILDRCNDYLTDLYTSDLDFSKIHVFSSLQQLSFSSYGKDKLSSVSLLIDSILVQNDPISKSVADAALCVYCNNLNLLDTEKERFLEILSERFKVNSDRSVPLILERVANNL